MLKPRFHGLLVVVLLAVAASCAPPPATTVAPTPSPEPVPSLMPGPAPTPTSTATPLPTWTPGPTLDPAAVAALAHAGWARIEASGIEPLCLRWEDTDGDGVPEWIGLYQRSGQPPQLTAFVLDGESWHDLRALDESKYGLGEYATCELEIRDVNADGRIEILVWGHAGTSIDLLNIFVWSGATYELLGGFEGKRGVQLENTDGDLADEVIVGYEAGSDLVWQAVYTWNGAAYGWTWERYVWFYLDRPHVYLTDTPVHAVISFYLAIDDRDLPAAYGLLSAAAQAEQSPEAWMVGYVTTVAVEVGAVHEVSRGDDTVLVTAQVRAYDNVEGRVVATFWDVEWAIVRTDAGWRLDRATAVQLDQWEATYYR